MPQPLQAQVMGAGPTGALAALALADAGWQVTIVDPLGSAALLERTRAYAFTHSSQRLLERLGLWQACEPLMVPFRRLELLDLGARASVPFVLADLAAPLAQRQGATQRKGAALGWIAQHRPLMAVLLARMEVHPAITIQLGQSGAMVMGSMGSGPADLVVAADGPHSPTRDALDIGLWQWSYRQSCLTAMVAMRGSDDDQAWELLRPEGPFAVLPLGDGHFQVVWSAPQGRCRQLESLADAAFLDALAGALPDRFQPDGLLDQPRAFPVSLQLARRQHRGSCVLLGESGHRCHPVGGQGLNLCWRDVAVLHRLAQRATAGRLAAGRLPAAYGLRRWPDLLLTLAATDLLVRLFSNRAPLLLPLRRLGLGAMARVPWLRRISLAA
ncbi:MAG: FAD-dependent monooxygenase, partial [Cyanobium sp. LacPavin_0920_WC12_MAG_62_9]|nr:FAD-dependent monooxygenase [Cyanobium sp. LacPavin_0920_WC12_MAG_62_9]